MSQKILSVIIPMYNSKEFISKCLDSLVVSGQYQEALDVIVVNDGSTDGCECIAETYVQRYPHMIRILNKENGGHGSAVNHGFAMCRGSYFKVLDADDWVETDKLEKLLQILPALDPCDVVTCHYHTFHIQSEKLEPFCAQMKQPVEYLSMEQVMERWMQIRHVFSLHGMIYRCGFYREVGRALPEKVSYDDAYFVTVAASRAARVCLLDRFLAVYRIGDPEQSVSIKNQAARISHQETVIRAVLETHDEARTPAGMEYWYVRTCSWLTSYFMTAFLRQPDRRAGRAQARGFWKEVCTACPDVARRMQRRYCLLAVMHAFHLPEGMLQAVMGLRK